jgi:hypothetical protein
MDRPESADYPRLGGAELGVRATQTVPNAPMVSSSGWTKVK